MLGITDEEYNLCVKKSLVSLGEENGKLLKNVLDKLRAGKESVYIAEIGGSVTEGAGPQNYTDGYAYQFGEKLKEVYAAKPEKVFVDVAGLSGSPSVLGLIRYQSHILDVLGAAPDLLLIEYSVNDWLECSNTRAYEMLIRNALEKGAAVICLYAAATYENQQSAHSPIARFYGVSEVSIRDAIKDSHINQEKDSKIFYDDYVHPVKEGHDFMLDCLMNLVQKIDTETPSQNYQPVIPENYKNEKPFTGFQAVFSTTKDANVKIDAGDFSKTDDNSQGLKKTTKKSFPDNWFYDGKSTGNIPQAFKITLKCKALILVYKHAGGGNSVEFGKADVFVDGLKTSTFDAAEPNGWNDCKNVLLIDEEKPLKHTVEIKMAQGDENKGFTILGLGYSL